MRTTPFKLGARAVTSTASEPVDLQREVKRRLLVDIAGLNLAEPTFEARGFDGDYVLTGWKQTDEVVSGVTTDGLVRDVVPAFAAVTFGAGNCGTG